MAAFGDAKLRSWRAGEFIRRGHLQFVLVNETGLLFSWSSPFFTSHHEHHDRYHCGQHHRP